MSETIALGAPPTEEAEKPDPKKTLGMLPGERSARLTNDLREQLVDGIMAASTMADRIKEAQRNEYVQSKALYDLLGVDGAAKTAKAFVKKHEKLMATRPSDGTISFRHSYGRSVPEAELRTSQQLSVKVPPKVRELALSQCEDGSERSMLRSYDDTIDFNMGDYYPMPNQVNLEEDDCTPEVAEQIMAATLAKITIRRKQSERDKERRKVVTALEAYNTSRQLMESWPEVCPVVREVMGGQIAPLPEKGEGTTALVPVLNELNESLGLPRQDDESSTD